MTDAAAAACVVIRLLAGSAIAGAAAERSRAAPRFASRQPIVSTSTTNGIVAIVHVPPG